MSNDYEKLKSKFEALKKMDLDDVIDFDEATHVKEKYQNNPDDNNSLLYSTSEMNIFYFYPLTTLTGRELNGIPVSKEKVTVCCIQLEKQKKVVGYLSSKIKGLDNLPNMENPTESIIDLIEQINFQVQGQEKYEFLNEHNFFVVTKEPITYNNIDSISKYIVDRLDSDLIVKENMRINISAIPITRIAQTYRVNPLRIIIHDIINITSWRKITVKGPNEAIGGTVKIKVDDGSDPFLPLVNTDLHPRIIFPVQFKPNIMVVDFWNSKQILNINNFFIKAKELGIDLNQSFSLQEFMRLGSETTPSALQIANVRTIEFDVNYDGIDISRRGGSGEAQDPFTNRTKHLKVDLSDPNIFYDIARSSTSNSTDTLWSNQIFEAGSPIPTNRVARQRATNINSITNLLATPRDLPSSTIAFDVIKKMLTYSYWKDREFDGAIKVVEQGGQFVEQIADKDIYLLRRQFEGQDRYSIVTNLWLSFKNQNPQLINSNPNQVQQIEAMLTMLSGSLKSTYSINKGDNDDYKVVLPFYFEIVNAPDQPIKYVEYTDIVVNLKSMYYKFEKNANGDWLAIPNLPNRDRFNFNAYFQLENNLFAFPDLNNNIETSAIPSTLPADIKLENGEYSKYLLYTQKESSKITFGNGNIVDGLESYQPYYEFDFEFTIYSVITEITVTAINGHMKPWVFSVSNGNKTESFSVQLFDSQNPRLATQTIII